jgi:hypothetical protein
LFFLIKAEGVSKSKRPFRALSLMIIGIGVFALGLLV